MAKEKLPKQITEKPDRRVTIEIPQGQFPTVLYANVFGMESIDGHKLVHFGLMMRPPAFYPLGPVFSRGCSSKIARKRG